MQRQGMIEIRLGRVEASQPAIGNAALNERMGVVGPETNKSSLRRHDAGEVASTGQKVAPHRHRRIGHPRAHDGTRTKKGGPCGTALDAKPDRLSFSIRFARW